MPRPVPRQERRRPLIFIILTALFTWWICPAILSFFLLLPLGAFSLGFCLSCLFRRGFLFFPGHYGHSRTGGGGNDRGDYAAWKSAAHWRPSTSPLPGIRFTSTCRVSPPTLVHAKPRTIPTSSFSLAFCVRYRSFPKYFSRLEEVTFTPCWMKLIR